MVIGYRQHTEENFKTTEASSELKWKLAPMPEMDQETDDLWKEGMIVFLNGNYWKEYKRSFFREDQEGQYSPRDHSWPTFLKEYYEEGIAERLDYIQVASSETKLFQEIREKHHDNWEIVEMCREILFENVKLINRLQEGIENDRTEIKKLSRV
jgi:hypothetical protein